MSIKSIWSCDTCNYTEEGEGEYMQNFRKFILLRYDSKVAEYHLCKTCVNFVTDEYSDGELSRLATKKLVLKMENK